MPEMPGGRNTICKFYRFIQMADVTLNYNCNVFVIYSYDFSKCFLYEKIKIDQKARQTPYFQGGEGYRANRRFASSGDADPCRLTWYCMNVRAIHLAPHFHIV